MKDKKIIKPRTIILLGLPGSGKGTQTKLLVENYGFRSIQTGEIVRRLSYKNPDIKNRMKKGLPQRDQVIYDEVERLLSSADKQNSYVYDAFPLSIPQAKWLDQKIIDYTLPPPIAIEIKLPKELVVSRILSRRICVKCGAIYLPNHKVLPKKCSRCGTALKVRPDDTKAAIGVRINKYEIIVRALAKYYRQKREYVSVDGRPSIKDVQLSIQKELQRRGIIYGTH